MVYEIPSVCGPYFMSSEHLQILPEDEKKSEKTPPKYLTCNILQK